MKIQTENKFFCFCILDYEIEKKYKVKTDKIWDEVKKANF